jgi:hypothetical protein
MAPFSAMLFLGNFFFVLFLAGLNEIVEALILTFTGAALSERFASDAETLAGSVLGDWALNDLMGIFAAWVFLRLFAFPSLLSPWYHSSVFRPVGVERAAAEVDPQPPGELPREENAMDRDLERWRARPWPRLCGRYWWKQHGLMLLYMISGVMPIWGIPWTCDVFAQPYQCANAGLMLSVVWQLALITVFATVAMRTKDDERYLWRPAGLARRRVTFFFVVWALFVVMVGMQNAQPLMPCWFMPPFGEWAQPWLFVGLWFLIILVLFAVDSIFASRFSNPRTRRRATKRT